MNYTGMPMGMWYLFKKSLKDNLVAIMNYDQKTADTITAKAKWKYKSKTISISYRYNRIY